MLDTLDGQVHYPMHAQYARMMRDANLQCWKCMIKCAPQLRGRPRTLHVLQSRHFPSIHRLYQNVTQINHHRPLCPRHRGSPHLLSAG